jgi:hypothetical protein
MTQPPEKRRTARIQPFVAPCRLSEGARRLSGYVTDLSTRGAQVSADGPPPTPDAHVVLEVRLSAAADPVRLPAVVKWVRPAEEGESYAFGLTFIGTTPEDQKALDAVVEEFRRRAEQLSS